MAGIGFELRKIYNKEGLLSKQRAYAYAAVVYTGPMMLGIFLTIAVVALSMIAGVSELERNYLLSNLTYAMIFSLIVTTFFSMIVTRYAADMLFEQKRERLLPSFYASSALMLAIGSPLYGIYLFFASRHLVEGVLGFLLFGELCLVWNVIIYLTAVKSYRKILQGFLLAIGVTIVSGAIGIILGLPFGLLFSVCLGYGVMLLWMLRVIHDYFPSQGGMSFEFLTWFDQFPELAAVGIYMLLGLFAHILVNWFGPISQSFDGYFRTAPIYDVPAMLAFLTTLVSTLNFVMSVEISFYPQYRFYFDLFNNGGNLDEITQSERRMLSVMRNELKYVLWKQLLVTILFMFVGSVVLTYLPIGFNNQMQGYFLTLCLGYGLYAVGNVNILMLLYFTDYSGAKKCAKIFAGLSLSLSILSQFMDTAFLGFGFLVASLVLFWESSKRLDDFTSELQYRILGGHANLKEGSGWFSQVVVRINDFKQKLDKS